jgi:hypothetical protein
LWWPKAARTRPTWLRTWWATEWRGTSSHLQVGTGKGV